MQTVPRIHPEPEPVPSPEPAADHTSDTALVPRRFWARLGPIWITFWVLMFALGAQEYFWGGGRRIWQPMVDYGTAALLATVLAVVQIRRAHRHDALLDRPLRWLLHVWAWFPLQMATFIAAMYGSRAALYAVLGVPDHHGHWLESLSYEIAKFTLFYALLGGVQFGVRSYHAWVAERLRAEAHARLAQQAQLAQLTQQLQPHFLFNAMNTVSSLIHTDPELADTLLTRLATLLRAATDASHRPEQPLADELALLQAYADIMVQRYADRASVSFVIDDAARDCRVPTLGLQPLLENCFRHVVERRRAMTRIVVRASCADGRLKVEIEDDGEPLAAPPVPRIGLQNLRLRLASLHGERASLMLLPRERGGLAVRVELPCVH